MPGLLIAGISLTWPRTVGPLELTYERGPCSDFRCSHSTRRNPVDLRRLLAQPTQHCGTAGTVREALRCQLQRRKSAPRPDSAPTGSPLQAGATASLKHRVRINRVPSIARDHEL